jgi:hypothetical protein
MPDNALDILRLRAKAKAKAQRERGEQQEQPVEMQQLSTPTENFNAQTMIPAQPFGWKPNVETPAILQNPFLGQGIKQAQRGNIIGGAGNIASGIVQGAMSPITTTDQTLRQIPYAGQLASNLINSPMNLLGDIKKDIIHPIVQGLGIDENLGMKPETAEGISNAISNLAPFALAKTTAQIAGKVGTSVAQSASRLANRLEQPAIGVSTGRNANVFENRELADFNLNKAKYGVGSKEHIRLNTDIGKVQGTIDSKLANAKSAEISVDINPVIDATRKELSSPKYIGQRNVLNKVLEEVNQNFEDVLKDYPNGKLPPDVAYSLKRNIADLASNAFDNPNANMLRRTYKSVTGKLLDAIEQQVPGIRTAGLFEEKLMDLESGIGRKQIKGEAGVPGGHMASWKLPIVSNPTVLHGAATTLNKLGGGFMNPELMGSVPASADLSRVSMPRGQGGHYQEPPYYNGTQEMPDGTKLEMYTDMKTGSTFVIQPGETLQQAVNRVHKRFGL